MALVVAAMEARGPWKSRMRLMTGSSGRSRPTTTTCHPPPPNTATIETTPPPRHPPQHNQPPTKPRTIHPADPADRPHPERHWPRGWREGALVAEDDIAARPPVIEDDLDTTYRPGGAAPHPRQHAENPEHQTTSHRLCRPPAILRAHGIIAPGPAAPPGTAPAKERGRAATSGRQNR